MRSMGTTARDGRGPAAARLLGLLVVLLGLLSMHGLTSTHHAAAAVPVPSAVTNSAEQNPPGPEHHDPGDSPATAGTAAATGHAVAVGLPGPVCDTGCPPDAAVLCLAVLVVACAVAVLTATGRRQAGPHRSRRPGPLAGRPARRRSPSTPDPVKDLCVSRK